MEKAYYTLISGRRNNLIGTYYEFSVSVNDEKIYFEEIYEYYGEDGREFEYALEIAAVYFDAFLALLLKRCAYEQPIPQNGRNELAGELLRLLVSQGEFMTPDVSEIKANLAIVHNWLVEENIPHKAPFLVY